MTGDIWAVADARRGLVYGACFDSDGERLTRKTPDAAMSLERLAREIEGPCLMVGDGAGLGLEHISQEGARLAPGLGLHPQSGAFGPFGGGAPAAGPGAGSS